MYYNLYAIFKLGSNKWCNGQSNNAELPLPEQSTLEPIAEAVLTSTGKTTKGPPGRIVKVFNISGNAHPNLNNTSILNFTAQTEACSTNPAQHIPISVLMKKTTGPSSIELQAYSTLFKDLQPESTKNIYTILSEHQQQANLFNLIPRPYLVQNPFLFLENPVDHQLSATPKKCPLDFNHCLLAVETLARFHASSYILRRQLGIKGKGKLEMLQKYPFLNQQQCSQYSNRMSSQLAPVFEQAFDLAVRIVQQDDPSLAFKLQRKVVNPEGIFDKVVKLLEDEKYDNDDFYVACHGNYVAANLIFGYTNKTSQDPTNCRITNFESMFFGPLASDLALFLLTCTTLEFRLEFEEKLLAFYCDAFQEQMVAKYGRNSGVVEEFEENIDEFHRKVEKQYKKMMEFAFYNACVLLPMSLSCGDAKDNASLNSGCFSVKDLLDKHGNNRENCFSGGDFEKQALANPLLKDRLMDIVKQLAKYRVLL